MSQMIAIATHDDLNAPPGSAVPLQEHEFDEQISTRDGVVLVVEDNRDFRESLRQLLEIEGFRAASAENGRDALDYLAGGERVALILLDLMMPVMDGWEFRRRQLATPSIAGIPVLILTALGPMAHHVAELEAAHVFKKPLNFSELLATIEHFAAKRP